MLVYRISKSQHIADISGRGAALYPGRWNKKGTPILYTGESKEIALLENLVHLPPLTIPNLAIITLEIPDDNIENLDVKQLPSNWYQYPAPTSLSELGQKWVNNQKSLALKVPSSIVHTSFNVLINCQHPNFKLVRVVDQSPFHFDTRLIR